MMVYGDRGDRDNAILVLTRAMRTAALWGKPCAVCGRAIRATTDTDKCWRHDPHRAGWDNSR